MRKVKNNMKSRDMYKGLHLFNCTVQSFVCIFNKRVCQN